MIIAQLMTATWFLRPEKCCCCMLVKARYMSASWCVVVSVVTIVAVCWWRLGTSVSLDVLFLLLPLLLYVGEGSVHQWVLVCCCFCCCYCWCMLMKAWYISESWCVVVSVVAIVTVRWWRLGTSVSLGVLFPLLLYVSEGSVHQLVLVCCCFCCCWMLMKAWYISESWCVVSVVAVVAVCWWRRGDTAAAPAPRRPRGNTSGRRSSSTLQHKNLCWESGPVSVSTNTS